MTDADMLRKIAEWYDSPEKSSKELYRKADLDATLSRYICINLTALFPWDNEGVLRIRRYVLQECINNNNNRVAYANNELSSDDKIVHKHLPRSLACEFFAIIADENGGNLPEE